MNNLDRTTLVLGLGNLFRGDDGVGPRIIEELIHRGVPEGVAVQDVGNAGLDLLNILEGWKRAVIVDTAEMGQEPGRFVRFTPDEVQLTQASTRVSLHDAGLSEVLALADALNRTLPELVIFGVQPAEFGWREGLSPAVEAAIPALTDAVIAELSNSMNHPDS